MSRCPRRSTLFPYTTLFRSLSDQFTEDYFLETLSRSRRPMKHLLLDQTRVLGLGNIYAVEALFLAGVDRKSTRLNSSHSQTSYAVFCLKKKSHPTRRPVSPA